MRTEYNSLAGKSETNVSTPVAEIGKHTQLGLMNHLLGDTGKWTSLVDLLSDVRTSFQLDGVAFRWPSEGYAVFSGASGDTTRPAMQYPVNIPGKTPGLLTVAGTATDVDWLKLLSHSLGVSGMFGRLFAPFADQARIAQRLEDAGRVAGRVAHDFDNVFQGVTGFASLALETLSPNSAAGQNVNEVQVAAQHGMKFNVQLHQLSRGGKAQPFPAAVPPAITREVTRVNKTHHSLKIDVFVPATLPPVAMESGAVQLVVGHLLDNAAEVSPKGGTVTVTARLVELAAEDFDGFLGQPTPGPNVEIVIRDSGPGLTDDARRRMFVEPFFTTKFRHRGLSLSVVYRMLYAHRGGVQVDGQPGRGTTVKVVLPLAGSPAPAVSNSRSSGGSAT